MLKRIKEKVKKDMWTILTSANFALAITFLLSGKYPILAIACAISFVLALCVLLDNNTYLFKKKGATR